MYYLRWYGLRVEAALRRAAIQKRGKGRGRRRAAQPDLSVQSSIGATDIMWRIRSALKLGDMGGGGVCAWAFHAAFLEVVGEGQWPEVMLIRDKYGTWFDPAQRSFS